MKCPKSKPTLANLGQNYSKHSYSCWERDTEILYIILAIFYKGLELKMLLCEQMPILSLINPLSFILPSTDYINTTKSKSNLLTRESLATITPLTFWFGVSTAIVLLWKTMNTSYICDFGLDHEVVKTLIKYTDSSWVTALIYRLLTFLIEKFSSKCMSWKTVLTILWNRDLK